MAKLKIQLISNHEIRIDRKNNNPYVVYVNTSEYVVEEKWKGYGFTYKVISDQEKDSLFVPAKLVNIPKDRIRQDKYMRSKLKKLSIGLFIIFTTIILLSLKLNLINVPS